MKPNEEKYIAATTCNAVKFTLQNMTCLRSYVVIHEKKWALVFDGEYRWKCIIIILLSY